MAVPFPFLLLCLLSQLDFFGADSCLHPIFVRWPRVRLRPQAQGAATKNGAILPLADCQKACADNKQPARGGGSLQCSAFNHRPAGHGSYEGDCQLFSREHVQHTDGYMEADDRYTFYWKYCIDVVKSCTGEYAFTFLSDRFMHRSEVVQTKYTKSLEECLAECLENGKILCRSVSFNRTDGGCHLSEQNQLSKPASVTINNNPNYRIDYYENNCYNNSFTFASFCEADGIRVRVDSRIPYTGALYGLYDFFSCRMEPREQRHFELLFPYPHLARNCSDSMRQAGQDVVLEVVLSTDGVEPLYFITGDDLTYQARCPVPKQASKSISLNHVVEEQTARVDEFFRLAEKEAVDQRSRGASVQTILEALGSSSGGPSSSRRFESSSSSVPLSTTAGDGNTGPSSTGTSFTKDVFTLPLYTLVPAPAGPHKDSAPEQPGRAAQSAGIETTNPWLAAADAAKSAERPPTTAVPSNRSELASPATSTSSSSAPEAGDRSTQPKQQQQQPPPTRATTLIVQQQQQPAELLDGWNDAGHRRKGPAGMEPIFDEADEPPKFPSSTSTATSSSPLAYSLESTATAKTTTKRAASFGEEWRDGTREFSFSTHLAFPSGNKIQLQTSPEKDFPSQSPTTTTTTTTTSVQTTAAQLPTPTSSIESASSRRTSESDATSPRAPPEQRGSGQREKIIFEIFHNGQPAEAVVVGSRITLAFTPYFAIPPSHMSISGCQVEPIGSLYEWEKEPLAIIKEGCQADHVGLVCPPQKTDYGIRVTVEAFRYQTTTQVQYTCLVRVCPFASCAQITCPPVEGCPGEDIVSRTFGLRAKRQGFGRPAQQQLNGLPVADSLTAIQQQTRFQQPGNVPALQQQLISLGGDSLVRRRLIVVNSDDELRYYARTGELPQAAGL